MSERTLARKLAEEGTSYEQVLDQLRLSLALQYIKYPGISLSQIAGLLGYKTPTSFTHAFTRWTGRPPSAARNEEQLPTRTGGAYVRPRQKRAIARMKSGSDTDSALQALSEQLEDIRREPAAADPSVAMLIAAVAALEVLAQYRAADPAEMVLKMEAAIEMHRPGYKLS